MDPDTRQHILSAMDSVTRKLEEIAEVARDSCSRDESESYRHRIDEVLTQIAEARSYVMLVSPK